ncbi:hypothetical protein GGX14DRAFT_390697 [Mycena pura]|uniref:Uncharacterized protein n=1 Tax=Mycena pura TaxID=153505 RepID=A0AAD6VPH6_9AGAR|nr:hypothetical protein GGX14DRAFT_390697 [Mycena pura]
MLLARTGCVKCVVLPLLSRTPPTSAAKASIARLTSDSEPIRLEVSAPDLPYFKPSESELLQATFGLDLKSFSILMDGALGTDIDINDTLPADTSTLDLTQSDSESSENTENVDAPQVFPPRDKAEADRHFKLYEEYYGDGKQGQLVLVCAAAAFGHPITRRTWNRRYHSWLAEQGRELIHPKLPSHGAISLSALMYFDVPREVLEDEGILSLNDLKHLLEAAQVASEGRPNRIKKPKKWTRPQLVNFLEGCHIEGREANITNEVALSTPSEVILRRLVFEGKVQLPPKNIDESENAEPEQPKKTPGSSLDLDYVFFFRNAQTNYETEGQNHCITYSKEIRVRSPYPKRVPISAGMVIRSLSDIIEGSPMLTSAPANETQMTLTVNANDGDYAKMLEARYKVVLPALEKCSTECGRKLTRCQTAEKLVPLDDGDDYEGDNVEGWRMYGVGLAEFSAELRTRKDGEKHYVNHKWEAPLKLSRKQLPVQRTALKKNYTFDGLIELKSEQAKFIEIQETYDKQKLRKKPGYSYSQVRDWGVWFFEAWKEIVNGKGHRASMKAWSRALGFKPDSWLAPLAKCGLLVGQKGGRGPVIAQHGQALHAEFHKHQQVVPQKLFEKLCLLYSVAATGYKLEGEDGDEGDEGNAGNENR